MIKTFFTYLPKSVGYGPQLERLDKQVNDFINSDEVSSHSQLFTHLNENTYIVTVVYAENKK